MRRRIGSMGVMAMLGLLPSAAWAGSPHFINNAFSETCNLSSLTVTGKEAGLGDEQTVHIALFATAECINPGGHHPKAENKQSVSTEGDFPVTNGKADFTLIVHDTISPSCSPPMTIVWVDVSVVDLNNGISRDLADCTP